MFVILFLVFQLIQAAVIPDFPSDIINSYYCVVSSSYPVYQWDGHVDFSIDTMAGLDAHFKEMDLCPGQTDVINYTTCSIYIPTYNCNSSYATEFPSSYHVPFVYPYEQVQWLAEDFPGCPEDFLYYHSLESSFLWNKTIAGDEDCDICYTNATSAACWGGSDEWCAHLNITDGLCGSNITTECAFWPYSYISAIKIATAYCSNLSWAVLHHNTSFLGTSKNAVIDPDQIFCDFTERTVILRSDSGFANESALFRKGQYAKVVDLKGIYVAETIPRSAYAKSGQLHVTVFDMNGKEIKQCEFEVTGLKTCDLHDCVTCLEVWDNFECLPPAIQASFILMWVLMGSCTLVSCCIARYYGAFKGSREALSFILCLPVVCFDCCFRSNTSDAVREKIGNSYMYIKNNFGRKQENMMKKNDNTELDDYEVKPLKTKNGSDFKLVILIIVLFAPLVLACDTSTVIPVNTNLCRVDNGYEVCSVQFSTTVTLPFIDSTACLVFSDDKDVKQVVEVTYNNDQLVSSLVALYHTSAYIVLQKSHSHCTDVLGFGGKKCSKSYIQSINTTDRTLHGEIKTPSIVNRPGESFAEFRANPGCFSGKNCIFSAYGINPVGEIHTVYEPGVLQNIPSVTINIKSNEVVKTKILTGTSLSYTYNNLTFKITGRLDGDPINFGTQKVISKYSDSGAFLANAAQASVPAGFSWGSIQSASSTGLQNPYLSKSSFIISNDIITTQIDNPGHTAFNYNAFSGLSNNTFPTIVNGNMWVFSKNKLYTNLTNPSPLIMQIDSGSQYLVSKKIQTVCPKLVNAGEASGCYSCTSGSNIVLRLSSSCLAGLVHLSSDVDYATIDTASIRLTQEPADYIINFHTTESSNEFNIIVSGNGGDIKIPVHFLAYEGVVLVNQSFIESNSTQEDVSKNKSSNYKFSDFYNSIGDWFDDIFFGRSSWWSYLVFSIAVSAVILFTLIGGAFIVKVYFTKSDVLKEKRV